MSLGQPSPPNVANTNAESTAVAGQQLQQINTPAAEENQAGSNYNWSGPTSSVTYGQTGTGPGGVPIYGVTTQYTPEQQQLLNTLQSTQQSGGTQAGQLLGGANYGAAQPSDVIGNMTSGLVGQNMQSYLAASDPFFATQTSQLDTQLRNQGLAPGDPAYDNAMRSNTTNQGYAVEGAAANFEPQAFAQSNTEYTLPATLSESLAGFGAPAAPGQGQTGGAALGIQTPNSSADLAADTTGAENQYTAQQAQYNAMISGLLGGAQGAANAIPGLAVLSDIRLKRDITKLVKFANGLTAYCFRYLWDDTFHVGVMAQEVQQSFPNAVARGSDGYLRVNYQLLGIPFMPLDNWIKA